MGRAAMRVACGCVDVGEERAAGVQRDELAEDADGDADADADADGSGVGSADAEVEDADIMDAVEATMKVED